MADATNANELESLVTRFTIDSVDFMTKSKAIIAETEALSAAIAGLSGEVILAVNGMTQVAATAITVMGQMSAELGNVARSLGTVTAGAGVTQLTTEINSLKTALSGLRVNRLQTLTTNIQGFATSLASLGSTAVNVGQLRTELDNIVTWLTNSSANFPKGATQLARSLSRITAAVHDMSLVQPGVMLANVQTITQAVNLLSTANVANLHQVAAALGNIGRAMRNIAGAGGGGVPPNIAGIGGLGGAGGGGPVGRLTRNLAAVPPAAHAATTSLRGVAHDTMIMQRNAEGAGAAILSLRYGLVGLAALGLYQFSQMDDALTRAMVHARDFGLMSRGELRSGIFDVSGSSTSGILELTKATDRLMSSGLSATAAMKVLGEAENFTVASGMKASEATKGLIDVMHGMGLVVADADGKSTTFRKNLGELSDLLVGVSAQSGATEKQMMEAFTSRFQTSAHLAQLSIQDSLAILGALARQGEGYRGQKGGNIAARGIESIVGDLSAEGQKMNMFGQTMYDAAGNVRPLLEVLTELQGMMAKVGTNKFIAEMKLANLGGPEKTNAVEPLLRTIAAMKDLRMEMAFMGGSAEKAANAIKETLMGQVQTLWNNLNATAMIIGEALAPALAAIMAPLNAMLNAFTKLNPAIQNIVIWGGLVLVTWRPLANLFLWLISPITNLASAFINLAMRGLSLVGDTFAYLWSWMVKIPTAMFNVGSVVITTVYEMFTAWGKLGMLITDTLSSMMHMMAKVVISFIGNFLVGLVGVITTLVSSMLILPPLLAAVGATLGTLVLAVGSLAVIVGTGLVQAWEYVRANSRPILEWMGNKIVEITDNASMLWKTLVDGSRNFFIGFKAGLTTVAGLLWNFRQNFTTIIDWLSKYSVQPFDDLVQASMKALEALGGNLRLLFGAVGSMINSVFNGVWFTVTEVFGRIRRWLAVQWENIGHDMNMIWSALGESLISNWTKIFSALFKLLDATAYQSTVMKGIFPDLDARAIAQKEEAFKELRSGFASPTDFFDSNKLKTEIFGSKAGTDLKTMLGVSGTEIKGIWSDVGTEIAKSFGKAFKEMNPILAAFSELQNLPIWKELFASLNFTVPGITAIGDYMKQTLGLIPGGAGTGEAAGKQGPGFTFKQGSLERFMYQGATTEKIQYQMLYHMQSIDKTLGYMAAQRNQSLLPGTTPSGGPAVYRGEPLAELGD